MCEVETPEDRDKVLECIVPSVRAGAPPKTRRLLPHRQIDQFPTPEIFRRFTELCMRTPGICYQESRLSELNTLALWIPNAAGPPAAFIDHYEFCHIHPLPEGSILLTLPLDLAHRAIEFGWAEQHTLALSGFMPETLVMVYAPRDEAELQTVWNLVMASFHFAAGK